MANEAKLNQQYTELLHRFSGASTWREFLELAKQFRELDTFKDASTYYTKCVRAASAGAYREYREDFATRSDLTSQDYFEAAEVLSRISDYMDAREWARTYKAKGSALCYAEAIALYEGCEGRWQDMREAYMKMNRIKGYKDSRDLAERYQKHYTESAYAAALQLATEAQSGPEYEEAAEIFEQIPQYSDSVQQAQKCRRAASKYRSSAPKKKKESKKAGDDVMPQAATAPNGQAEQTEVVRKKRARAEDSVSGVDFLEIWRSINKVRLLLSLAGFAVCLLGLLGTVYFSPSRIDPANEFLYAHGDKLRGVSVLMVFGGVVFGLWEFVRMLSPTLKRKLATKALEIGRRVAKPMIKAVNRVLGLVGIQIGRQRLKGKDEKSFVYVEREAKAKKPKKLRNEGKWHELPDNAARVRFIFVDYMIRKIKQGYRMKYSNTPDEIAADVAIEDDEKRLFEVYRTARYAGAAANEVIDNDLVDELLKINVKRS